MSPNPNSSNLFYRFHTSQCILHFSFNFPVDGIHCNVVQWALEMFIYISATVFDEYRWDSNIIDYSVIC